MVKIRQEAFFDMVNTILSQIFAPCLNMQPWVNTARNLAPLWGSEGLLEKVLQLLTQRHKELTLSKPEKKAFDQKWPGLSDCIDRVGRDVEKTEIIYFFDQQNKHCVGSILTSGQDILCQQLILDPSYKIPTLDVPSDGSYSKLLRKVARGICIISKSVKQDSSNLLIVFPPKCRNQYSFICLCHSLI
jgi:hypothetical protein